MTGLLVSLLWISSPPKLDPWYHREIWSGKIRIASSRQTSRKALVEARRLVDEMLQPIPEVRAVLEAQAMHVAVIASNEQTLDVPEYAWLGQAYPDRRWNEITRGLGPTPQLNLVSGAEENLLRLKTDRYVGESIFIHEFAHAILEVGWAKADPTYVAKVQFAFDVAMFTGKWQKTYAATNFKEYFAEGVQSFFAANLESIPTNGIHNHVNTPEELRSYDPRLYRLLRLKFGEPKFRWR